MIGCFKQTIALNFNPKQFTKFIALLTRTKMTFNHFYRHDVEDDLSELKSEAVPDEVRKWLASTFAKQEQVCTLGSSF